MTTLGWIIVAWVALTAWSLWRVATYRPSGDWDFGSAYYGIIWIIGTVALAAFAIGRSA